MKDLRCAQKVDSSTNFLTDNVIAYFMEALNHHNHRLHLQDQHAYCFDPQVVTRAEVDDGYGLRAFDPITAEAARYWLLPRNLPRCHWWLDVYDRYRHVLYRADSATLLHLTDPLPSRLWQDHPPEIRSLNVPQQTDGESCGDFVIQFALVVATPGWYTDSATLSRVLPWARSEMLAELEAGGWETQRPEAMLALSQVDVKLVKRARDAAAVAGVKRKLGYRESDSPKHGLDACAAELDSESSQVSPLPPSSGELSAISVTSPTSTVCSTLTPASSTPDRDANKRGRITTTSEPLDSGMSACIPLSYNHPHPLLCSC